MTSPCQTTNCADLRWCSQYGSAPDRFQATAPPRHQAVGPFPQCGRACQQADGLLDLRCFTNCAQGVSDRASAYPAYLR